MEQNDARTGLKISQLALIKACKELNIQYEIIHKHQILVKVTLPNKTNLFFTHHYKAFNREDIVKICKDKDLSYTILAPHIKVPKWKSYLAPNLNEKYLPLLDFPTRKAIANDIEKNFKYPVVLKRNFGSQGHNVYLCNNRADILSALRRIFSRSRKFGAFDYIAIAQEYIKIKKEYRVIAYKRKLMFAYEKNIDDAVFVGNLSPLHWENAKGVLVQDANILEKLEAFSQGVFNAIPINFVGLDIAIDENGEFFIIEINNSPGMGIGAGSFGMDPIVRMFKYILKDLSV